jgi:hypothetical protein
MRASWIALGFALAAGTFTGSPGGHPTPMIGDADTLALLAASRAAAKDFLTTLKGVLVAQLAAGGTAHAVTVCADTAQRLQREAAERHGLLIRRVSSRWRNSLDVPDEYEQTQLDLLEEFRRNGSLTERTEAYRIVHEDSVQYFRYMKPILVQSMCLSCHGRREAMSAELVSLLRQRYPEDTAFDYANGDLRGAVSVTIVIR